MGLLDVKAMMDLWDLHLEAGFDEKSGERVIIVHAENGKIVSEHIDWAQAAEIIARGSADLLLSLLWRRGASALSSRW